jgi:hypothetical protein
MEPTGSAAPGDDSRGLPRREVVHGSVSAPRNDGLDNLLPQPGDRLQIALVLAGEAQNEVRAAGAHVFVEPLGDARRRAGVARLVLAQHRRRLAVVSLEKTVELIIGALGVVVEHDV